MLSFHHFFSLLFQPPRPEAREPPVGREEQHQGGRLRDGVAAAHGLHAGDQLRVAALRVPGGHQGEKSIHEQRGNPPPSSPYTHTHT